MTTQQPEALRLADEWQRKTQREADRQNSAYDRYGMGNTPETVDPLGSKMVAELRRQHAYCQELESQVILDCMTHVQNPAEIEHVSGDMTTPQPVALKLAEMLPANEWLGHVTLVSYARECVAELLTQHARITELESQLAQRFDAADMATAAAQGFRDGAASVSRLTDLQIASACMSYRHDFGLLDDAYKEQLVYEARSWEYAFAKEREWAAADGESNV